MGLKNTLPPLRRFAILPALVFALAVAAVQPAGAQKTYEEYSRWSAGINAGIPFFMGDMTSFAYNGTYAGFMGGLQAEYRFSPLMGLRLSADAGKGKVGPYGYSRGFYLDTRGRTSCCPSLTDISSRYDALYGEIAFFSAGLHGDINLNRLFYPEGLTRRWTVLFSPAVYLQHYSPRIYANAAGSEFTDRTSTNKLGFAAGADLVLRMRVGRTVDMQLASGLVWIADPLFDGIDCSSRPLSNMGWNTQLGVVFKFNGKRHRDNILYAARQEKYAYEPLEWTIVPVPVTEPEPEVLPQEPLPVVSVPQQEAPAPETKEKAIAKRLFETTPVAYFTRGNAKIDTVKYAGQLQAMMDEIESRPDSKIYISAYGDLSGSAEANEIVTGRRGQALHKYLVEHGVSPDRIVVIYAGVDNELTGTEGYSEKARRVAYVLED